MLQVLHLPIRAMRLITDPIVDFFAYLLVELTLPWIIRIFKGVLRLSAYIGYNLIRASINDIVATKVAVASSKFVRVTLVYYNRSKSADSLAVHLFDVSGG
jgi:E3 ubiquitin-protein ligase MARCH6